MFKERVPKLEALEAARNSKVLVFVTGDRPNLQTEIAQDGYDLFVHHLDKIGVVPTISLYLYTRGGDTLSAWSLVNLVRQFCDTLEIVIPSKAHSAGTLMALGADRIVMTKQATLGPIDPSIRHPLAPQIPGRSPDSKVSVSVEAITGYIELARSELALSEPAQLGTVLAKLTDHIHPLVLGAVFRSKTQIQMLARRLLQRQVVEPEKVNSIISFLCSESGSHDYTIHRREATELGLVVEKPTEDLYGKIKDIYDNVEKELCLGSPFDPKTYLGSDTKKTYSFKRAIIQSVAGGCHYCMSEGEFEKQSANTPAGLQLRINDQRNFEGWKHEY